MYGKRATFWKVTIHKFEYPALISCIKYSFSRDSGRVQFVDGGRCGEKIIFLYSLLLLVGNSFDCFCMSMKNFCHFILLFA